MKLQSFCLIILAFFASLNIPAFAQNRQIVFPRLEPDPKALEYFYISQRNSELTWQQLAEISLWASGDTTLSGMQRIKDAVAALNSSNELPVPGRERAEFILTYMHSNILRAYSRYQTRLDTVFTNGRFNCVSSAVLYMILCRSAGINTSGVITKDHAFVIVHIDGQNIDVETTNRFGFEPGSRREFHDQFGRLTGFTYVPAQNYRDRQTITQIELISIILNNRIADLERANRHAEAVPLAVDRTALLLGAPYGAPHGDSSSADMTASSGAFFENPRKELLDRLINYGAALLRSNREEEALGWAITASAVYPDSERWQELKMAAINNRTMRFIRERRPAEARNFLESNRRFLSQNDYAEINAVVVDAELLSRANQISNIDEGNAVVNDIEQAWNSGKLNNRRAVELLTFAVQRTAAILCAAPTFDWRAAINYIESAISRFGTNRDFEQTLRTYRGNLAADYHNRFAAEWNRGNYDEAERILAEGLAEFPNNTQLLANREIVNRQRR